MQGSASRHNSDDLQPISCGQLALAEFRRGNGFAVVLHNNAAGQKLLREKKRFDGAGELCFDLLAIGNN